MNYEQLWRDAVLSRTNFDFTIAISPDKFNLDRELYYIKAVLLYADKISLISPMAYFYSDLCNKKILNVKEGFELLNKIMPFLSEVNPQYVNDTFPAIKKMEKLVYSKNYKMIPMSCKLDIMKNLRELTTSITEVFIENISSSSCSDLEKLVNNNKLKILTFEQSIDNSEKFVNEYFFKLTDAIANSYPIFDDESNSLIKYALDDHIIDISAIKLAKVKNSALSQRLMTRIPSFENSSIDEILDIRNELENPLIRFRGKILEFTNEIQSVPWNDDFNDEVDIFYSKTIEPALLEINELTNENGFLKNLGKSLIKDGNSFKNLQGLSISLAAGGVLSAYTKLISTDPALLVAGAAWTSQKLINSYLEYVQNHKNIEKKELYFYYKASEKISR